MPEGIYSHHTDTGIPTSDDNGLQRNIIDSNDQFHFDTSIKGDPSKVFDLFKIYFF